jgi:glyceraldehyde 3-phosphate dehydrogenase
MTVRVGINGFGRTGRALLRAARHRDLGLDVVAVNDLATPAALARLLARDSVFGRYDEPVSVEGTEMVLGDHRVAMPAEPDLGSLPWRDLGVDVVVECTGRFTARDQAARHLDAGAPRVVVSAPSKGADATFVMGVNDDTFDPERHLVVSNASCTTNCLVPMVKVLDDAFGVERGFMTTVHAYTGDQRLVDSVHKDPRRARAAAVNIVPTTTGAARATGEVLTHLAGRLDGIALRVPVPDGSMTDLVATVREDPTAEDVREAFRRAAADGPLAGRLEYGEDGLVSSDVVGDPASCVFDAELTMAADHVVKVLGWYDNEWGYANRLAELAALVGSSAGGVSR